MRRAPGRLPRVAAGVTGHWLVGHLTHRRGPWRAGLVCRLQTRETPTPRDGLRPVAP